MAFWRKKASEFDEMFHLIRENPGIKPGKLARVLNVNRSTVIRRLPSMEEAGYLLYEDETGGLWSFEQRNEVSV